jgi:hypothetical protein
LVMVTSVAGANCFAISNESPHSWWAERSHGSFLDATMFSGLAYASRKNRVWSSRCLVAAVFDRGKGEWKCNLTLA